MVGDSYEVQGVRSTKHLAVGGYTASLLLVLLLANSATTDGSYSLDGYLV